MSLRRLLRKHRDDPMTSPARTPCSNGSDASLRIVNSRSCSVSTDTAFITEKRQFKCIEDFLAVLSQTFDKRVAQRDETYSRISDTQKQTRCDTDCHFGRGEKDVSQAPPARPSHKTSMNMKIAWRKVLASSKPRLRDLQFPKIPFFWDVTVCPLASSYGRFERS